MPPASPRRRSLAARIAKITDRNGPDDPRLPALRAELDACAIDDIHDWAHRAAAALPPFDHGEIHAVAASVSKLDARLSRRADPDVERT